jgi:hypothetical protein
MMPTRGIIALLKQHQKVPVVGYFLFPIFGSLIIKNAEERRYLENGYQADVPYQRTSYMILSMNEAARYSVSPQLLMYQ